MKVAIQKGVLSEGVHEPFRVTMKIVSQIQSPALPVHLDSLLASARVQELVRAGDDSAFDKQLDLPLTRYAPEREENWVFCASRFIYVGVSRRQRVHFIRKLDVDGMAKDKGEVFHSNADAVTTGTGFFKNYSLTTPVMCCSHVVAWGIGEIREVKRLLGQIESFGKYAAKNYGEIAAIEVVPDDAARERWMVRTMPDKRPGYRAVQATIKPRYSDRSQWILGAWEPPAMMVMDLTLSMVSMVEKKEGDLEKEGV